jgi:hypothetical protein
MAGLQIQKTNSHEDSEHASWSERAAGMITPDRIHQRGKLPMRMPGVARTGTHEYRIIFN